MNPGIDLRRNAPLSDAASALLGIIHAWPGCNIRQARHLVGLGRKPLDVALQEILERGQARRFDSGGRALLFPALPGIEECWLQVAVLGECEARLLHRALDPERTVALRRILDDAAHEWGWAREVTRWRLHRLEDATLVRAVVDFNDQRCIRYRTLPIHPLAAKLLQVDGVLPLET